MYSNPLALRCSLFLETLTCLILYVHTGNIRVYCRVRPFLPGKASGLSAVDHVDEGSITIITPSKYGKEGRKSFTFNKVFGPAASQGH